MSADGEQQREAFAVLGDAATHGGAPVRRIDTHAAVVFLAGDKAFKVKRQVRFPFLDYSSLALRKRACEAELEVNRPFAPRLYRRVVAITREADGALALDGAGEPVEFAVEMQRFDENQTLDVLAERKAIELDTIDAVARLVAESHRRAPRASAAAFTTALSTAIEQNVAQCLAFPNLFAAEDVRRLGESSQAALQTLRPLVVARGEAGRVRRGHGDLHLGNIALIDGRPLPFDALEFDPRLASGDVLYDLAFLLMDLVERGLPVHANLALNRYLGESREPTDLDALAALPLFMSLRASIRAKVTAARLHALPPERHAATSAAARHYFKLALALLSPARAALVAVGGLSGTGKSAVARLFAPEIPPLPGAILLRSDVERKHLFGVAETERLASHAYSVEATERVYAILLDKARRIVTAGHSAILDAVFSNDAERAGAEALARDRGVSFVGVFLKADFATRLERIGKRYGDASDADAAVAQRQESYVLADLAWPSIDAGGSLDSTAALVREALRKAGLTLATVAGQAERDS